MLSRLAKTGSSLVILLSIAVVISACGRRGALEAPPSELSGFEEPAGNETGQPEEAPAKPDKPFILDPLL